MALNNSNLLSCISESSEVQHCFLQANTTVLTAFFLSSGDSIGGSVFCSFRLLRTQSHCWSETLYTVDCQLRAVPSFQRPPVFPGSRLPSSIFKASSGGLSSFPAWNLSSFFCFISKLVWKISLSVSTNEIRLKPPR